MILLKTLTIFVIMSFGYALRRRGMIDAAFNRMLAGVLMSVFYPALIFASLTRAFTLETILSNAMLPVGTFLIMLTGWLVGAAAQRFLRHGRPSMARLFHFQCAANNYSFLPLMLAAVLWDEAAIALVVFSTLGAELFIWTFGIQALTGSRVRLGMLRHLCTMPMLAMVAAFIVILARAGFDSGIPGFATGTSVMPRITGMLHEALRITGQATIPVSAIIAGSRIAGLHPAHVLSRPIAAVTALRLIAIPALSLGVLALLPLSSEVYMVLAIVAVMPCALTSVTLAELYDSDADFAAASVLSTHLGCILTIPIWLHLLGVG